MDRDKSIVGDDVLTAGTGEAHRMPVVVDGDVRGTQQKKPRLRRPARLRNHAAEELPLRVVATTTKAARTGNDIAAVHRLCPRHRRVGTGRKRAAIAPDLLLRLFR